jgi:hypothetical protein
MRTIAILAMAVLAATVLAASASAAHRSAKPAPTCRHVASSRLRLADGQAEVYIAPESRSDPELVVYGCAFRTGRAHELGGLPSELNLGGPGGESGVLDATLAGTVVAYERSLNYEDGGGRDLVFVRDLRTGRVLHEVLTGTRVKPEAGFEGVGAVVALVVKSDGSVAWIVATDAENGTRQVHAVDRTGSRTLATGSNIAPGSLALAGSTLYWTQGGQAQSATLN